MKKRVFLMFLMLLLLLTGCSKNFQSSPESVAKEVATRLSNGNYDNILELVNIEEKVFIDQTSFVNFLDEESLKIEGNKKVEIVKTIKSDEDNVTVEIKIDDYKILKINTIKKENNWYVNLDKYDFAVNFIISVPTGAKVKLNDIELNFETYGSTNFLNMPYNYGDKTYSQYYEIDIYTIPKILKGNYKLQVEHNSIETVNTTIDTNSYNNNDSTNFYSTYLSDNSIRARINSGVASSVKTTVNNYFNELVSAINSNDDFSTLEKYFVTNNYSVYALKNEYNSLLGKKQKNDSGENTTFTSVTLENIKYNYDYVGLYHGGDEVVTFVEYTIKYSGVINSDNEQKVKDETKTYKAIIHLFKEGNLFKINDGTNLIPLI